MSLDRHVCVHFPSGSEGLNTYGYAGEKGCVRVVERDNREPTELLPPLTDEMLAVELAGLREDMLNWDHEHEMLPVTPARRT